MKKITLCRKAHFNAAHRLYNDTWSVTKNEEVFGKCSNPHFHGHNYELIVEITGIIDPETGFVISADTLKKIIKENVLEILDHKNLNIEIAYFQTHNPTAENIAVFIWNSLKPLIKKELALGIILYETPRNFVKYNG